MSAVQGQPRGSEKAPLPWMQQPAGTPDCPPGLEYLTMLDQVIVEQQVHLVEVLLSWECNNKYRVMNSMKQQCFYAAEKTDTCMRLCCGPYRSFSIHIVDNTGKEVLRVRREFKCCGGCCWCASADCAAHEITVETPDGKAIGYVRQLQSGWRPNFGVFNERHEQLFRISGPCCSCQGLCCTADKDFPVFSMKDGSLVSKISKTWSGAARELFTDAETFSVTFPMDLDVKVKAVLMSAVFLIDFMYYEHDESTD